MTNDSGYLAKKYVAKKDALAYILSLPFILAFATIMVGCDLLQRLFYLFSRKILAFFGFLVSYLVMQALRITGLKLNLPENNFPKDQPLLIVSNHQSLMDIAILWVYFRKNNPHFIAKRELTRYLPFVAFNLRKYNHIIIDRSNPAEAIQMLKDQSLQIAKTAESIVMFPEGTRARDGKVKKFKKAGLLAICKHLNDNNVKVNVVPVCINGAWKISLYKLLPVPRNLKVTVSNGKTQLVPETTEAIDELIVNIEQWINNEINKNEQ